MPASKDFSSYFTDYFSRNWAEKAFGEGIYDIGKATVEQGAEYWAAALSKFEEAGRSLGSTFDMLESGNFGAAISSWRRAFESEKSALKLTAGATVGAVATPIEMVIMGGLQAAAPSAVEPLAEWMQSIYDAAGGTLEDRAMVDAIFGSLGIGGIGGATKVGKIARWAKNVETAIEDSMKVTEPVKVGLSETIAKNLAETKARTGRMLSTYDVTKAIQDAGQTIDDSYVSRLPERDLSGIPEEIFTEVGERTNLKKDVQRAILDSLEAKGIDRSKAWNYVKAALKENQRLAQTNVDPVTKIKEAIDIVAAKSEMGKDVELRKFKYDAEDSIVADAYALLEDEGILNRTTSSDGLYSFTWGDNAGKYINEDTRLRTANGVAHYPIEGYDRARAARWVSQLGSFDDAAKTLMDSAIDSPLDAPRILNRIEEASGDVAQLKRPSTTDFLYKSVVNAADEADITWREFPKGFEADLRSLWTRLDIPTDQVFDVSGKIDKVKLAEVLKQIDDAKANGFKPVRELPIPDTLKNMLRRDEKVAQAAFSRGVNTEKVVAARKIRELKERARTASDADKALYAKRISELESKYNRVIDWKTNAKFAIRNILKADNEYKFYGTKSDVFKLEGKYGKMIDSINSFARYQEVMSKVEAGIHRTNAEAIASQISDVLKKYKRPAGKTTAKSRKIEVKERLLLEAMAQWVDRYNKSWNVSDLLTTLNDVKAIEKLGIEEFKKNTKASAEEVNKTISEATKDWLNSIGGNNIDDKLLRSSAIKKKGLYLLDPLIQIREVFKNNPNNPAWNKVMEMMDADRRIQLLSDRFVKEVAEPLDKAGWIGAEKSRQIGIYLATKQSDWAKRIYNKDGKFIGNNIFPFTKFADEAEYLKYIDWIKKEIEGQPKVLEAIKKAEEIRNEIDWKSRLAAILFDKYQYGRVDNYYPQRAIRNGAPIEYADNIFEGDWFRKGYQDERVYDKATQYDPDFFDDYMRYINTQGRYGEMRGDWGNFSELVNKWLLKDTNNYTRELFKSVLRDLANPQPLRSSWFSRATSRVSKITLAWRITTMVSQLLSIPEAAIRVNPAYIAKGSMQAFRPKVVLAAQEASTALKLAKNWGMLVNEMQKISDASWLSRFFDNTINTMMVPIGKFDSASKVAVWLSAYAEQYAKKYGKQFDFNNPEFLDRDIILHADDVVESVVGTKTYARLPPILRDPTTRALSMLQTFVFKRMGQMFYELPRKFRDNPIGASAALATYAVTGVLPMFIGLGYKEMLEKLAEITWQEWVWDEKEMAERLTWVKNATTEDILFSAAKQQITSAVPWTSSVISVVNYDRTGIGLVDFFKKSIDKVKEGQTAEAKGQKKKALGKYIEAGTSVFWEPWRILGEWLKATFNASTKATPKVKEKWIKRWPTKRPNIKRKIK